MANITTTTDLPPLPDYTLSPVPDLLPFISDFWLAIIAPHLAYWIVSAIFHFIDTFDLFPQYRLHTPEEITQRNLASRWEVARDVIIQQVLQCGVTAILSLSEPIDVQGKEQYDVAIWATRIRLAQRALPGILGLLGLNALSLAKSMSGTHPLLAGALSGGHYPQFSTQMSLNAGSLVPAFATWELAVAKAIYWVIIPTIQVYIAAFVLDAWQYALHRLMHVNKWLYTTLHSRHHRLYVPYAYGALYNHPLEGFLLDILGSVVAYKASGMTQRMGMLFFTGTTMKTVDDHCGYALPFDPLQHLTSNNAAYHDIHHQSWGIKTNFSQPFFTVWDSALGTMWKGDTTLRYERGKAAAKAKAESKKLSSKAQ